MKLKELIKGIKVKKIIGEENLDIKDITIDSNKSTSGSLFICIKGKDYDGHIFAKQVEKYGCIAVVSERELDVSITQIIVDNSREVMAQMASNFYNEVYKKMKIIAIIGTNGKTTTAHLIREIMKSAGIKCGIIGTLGTYYLDKFIEPELTTPDPLDLHKILFDMHSLGIEYVVMEVSAHAIYLDKIKNIKFHTAIFTNFTQDHLDFFENMENYRQAKLKFFRENTCENVITNSDDDLGREIAKICPKAKTYGLDNPADVFAVNISCKSKKTSFFINLFDYVGQVELKMIGFFNVYNALASSSACALLGIKEDVILKALSKIKNVSGRLERIYSEEFDVIVDYAHTPDGLNKSLLAIRPFVSNRLICIFGCGGNRDVQKREIMGEISGALADFSIITSDNPRYEEPMEIIYQIEKGIIKKTKKYLMIESREDAIKYALDIAVKGDVILIAGKGSEKYQEILGIKRLYNDKDIVNEYIRGM